MRDRDVRVLPRLLPSVLLMTWTLGWAGCAHAYRVKVDAIQNPHSVGGASFAIVSKDAALPATDPQYPLAVDAVRTALAARGLYELPAAQEPELLVELDYSVSPRRYRVERERNPEFLPQPSQTRIALVPVQTANGVVIVPKKQEGPPTAEFLGQQTLLATPIYEKRLSIVARESSGGHAGDEVWRVEVTLEDETERIERVLPVLASTAAEHVGTNSLRKQVKKITDRAPAVAAAPSR